MIKRIILLLSLLFLVSCSAPFDCIDSDDFGYPKITVPSRGTNPFYSNGGTTLPQCSYWTDSQLTLTGQRLVMIVRSDTNWSPWLSEACISGAGSSLCPDPNSVIPALTSAQNCGFICDNPTQAGCSSGYSYGSNNPVFNNTNLAISVINQAINSININDIVSAQGYLSQASSYVNTALNEAITSGSPAVPKLNQTATAIAAATSSLTSAYLSTVLSDLNSTILSIGSSGSSYNSFYDINTCPNYVAPGNPTYPGNACLPYGAMGMNDPANVCLLNRGNGLYVLVVPAGTDISNNQNIACDNILSPAKGYYSIHMGGNPVFYDTSNSACSSADPNALTDPGNSGCITSGYSQNLPDPSGINTYTGDLYFKILDQYYADNSGSYTVMMKSGVQYQAAGPISSFVSYMMTYLNNAGTSIYQNLISMIATPVNNLLVLYIIFAGIFLMFGLTNMSKQELIVHVFKVGICVQLITSSASWSFFNDTLLSLFTNGVDEICCMIASGGTCTTSDPASNLKFFDNILSDFFSFETQMKIWSLPINDPGFGLVESILIEIGLIFFIMMILYAALFYVLGYLVINILISLFPIFLPFILFSLTKDVFENLLKKFISSSIEPILVIAFLALTAQSINHQFHSLLGFRICYQNLPGMNSDFKGWIAQAPSSTNPNSPSSYANILIPEYIQDINGNIRDIYGQIQDYTGKVKDSSGNILPAGTYGPMCEPYACSCPRIPTLPYLQPNESIISSSGTPCHNLGYDDQTQINYIISSGKYTQKQQSFSFFIMTGLMLMFTSSVPGLARILSTGSSQGFDMSSGPSKIISNFKKSVRVIDTGLGNHSETYRSFQDSRGKLIGRISNATTYMQDKIGGGIDFAKDVVTLKRPEIITAPFESAMKKAYSFAKTSNPGQHLQSLSEYGYETARYYGGQYLYDKSQSISKSVYGRYQSLSKYGYETISEGLSRMDKGTYGVVSGLYKLSTKKITDIHKQINQASNIGYDFATNYGSGLTDLSQYAYESWYMFLSEADKRMLHTPSSLYKQMLHAPSFVSTSLYNHFTSDEFIQSRFLPKDKDDNRPLIHDLANRASSIYNSAIRVLKFIPMFKNLEERDLDSEFSNLVGKDIGRTSEAALILYHTYKDHALNQASFGIFGHNMNKVYDHRKENDSTPLEIASSHLSSALNMDNAEMLEYLKGKGEFLSNFNMAHRLNENLSSTGNYLKNSLNDNRVRNSIIKILGTGEFNREEIIAKIDSLQDPNIIISIKLPNNNIVSLRAYQLKNIVENSNGSEKLRQSMLELVSSGDAQIAISSENKSLAIEKKKDFKFSKKSVDEIYELNPNEILELDGIKILAKDLKEIQKTNSPEDYKDAINAKRDDYIQRSNLTVINKLSSQLSSNFIKRLNGEEIEEKDQLLPHNVSGWLKKGIVASVIVPPVGMVMLGIASVNAVRNINNFVRQSIIAREDKRILKELAKAVEEYKVNSLEIPMPGNHFIPKPNEHNLDLGDIKFTLDSNKTQNESGIKTTPNTMNIADSKPPAQGIGPDDIAFSFEEEKIGTKEPTSAASSESKTSHHHTTTEDMEQGLHLDDITFDLNEESPHHTGMTENPLFSEPKKPKKPSK